METEITKAEDTTIRKLQAFSTSQTSYVSKIMQRISEKVNTLSIADILSSDSIVTLRQYINYNSQAHTNLAIMFTAWLGDTLMYMGVPKEQFPANGVVSMLFYDVVRMYGGSLSVEDVCLCFRMARSSNQYEKLYGRIDMKVVMSWFAKYFNERSEINISTHPKEKNINGDEISEEQYDSFLLSAIAATGNSEYNEDLLNHIAIQQAFFDRRYDTGNYKYQRKHKFDKAYETDRILENKKR